MAKKSKSKSKSRGKGKCGKGEVWRKGYTRASGTRVAGRCVKARGKSKSKSKSRTLSKRQRLSRDSKILRESLEAAKKRVKKLLVKFKKDNPNATRQQIRAYRLRIEAEEYEKAHAKHEDYMIKHDPDLARERGYPIVVDGRLHLSRNKLMYEYHHVNKMIGKVQQQIDLLRQQLMSAGMYASSPQTPMSSRLRKVPPPSSPQTPSTLKLSLYSTASPRVPPLSSVPSRELSPYPRRSPREPHPYPLRSRRISPPSYDSVVGEFIPSDDIVSSI